MSNPIKLRILTNKTLARNLRAKLLRGYAPDSRFAQILARLSDEQVVERFLNHEHGPRRAGD